MREGVANIDVYVHPQADEERYYHRIDMWVFADQREDFLAYCKQRKRVKKILELSGNELREYREIIK